MLPPAGNFRGTVPQGIAGQPLPSQHQAAGFSVTDHTDDGRARVGLQSQAHLGDGILGGIEYEHPRAGEFFLRHEGGNLRADKHQLWRATCPAGHPV